MALNPLTLRKLRRFRSIRSGYWSFLALMALIALTLGGELLVNNRPLVIRYEGQWFFPTYGANLPGTTFGYDYGYETDYRALRARFAAEREHGSGSGATRREARAARADNWLLMPPVPFNPNENAAYEGVFKPAPPSWLGGPPGHWLGTDTTGRDIFARLFYGFRTTILFALAFTALTYLIGIAVGCLMGYYGGVFDLIVQRAIEIWSNIPFLYIVIILFSVIPATFSIPMRIAMLLLIMVLFSWTSMTYYMRTATYREKARDYVAAAVVLGASPARVIFYHILPNTISTLVTFMPFTIASAITAVTALDFLGFGLPPPSPSIGELLKQGTQSLTTAPWIVGSAFGALVSILVLVTFIGEAVREAFDPKKFTTYQ
ncbi:peptide ABC transporter permease [Cephaloticoccus primus]|uniref:Peptide ABC transporter permease n=1 Tax=Cephaloticoccus primus TaxID=1548207 RepID=A0A139SUJ7_9BACT|nr:ABC transporter permease subunit [Cephaloticoccus primus]KXU38237.1 peptide ABC transporter permease [Cephaloticoccus primus]